MRRTPRFGTVLAFLSGCLLVVASVPASAQQKPVAVSGSARADERVGRRADQEGLAERRADPGEQLRRAARSPASRDQHVVVGRQRSTGSGFVIDPDGYIMTNAHVVSGARRVAGGAAGRERGRHAGDRRCRARLHAPRAHRRRHHRARPGAAEGRRQKLPALPLATYSQVRQGETVFAFGSPIGLRNSLTHGLVSAVARQVDPDSPLIYVQTDAPINPGQLRRTAGQHPRRSRGRQHVHRVAVRRQRRAGLRDPERDRPDRVPSAEAVRPAAPAGNRHELPDDHADAWRRGSGW